MSSTIPLQVIEGTSLNISNERLHIQKVLAVENHKLVINFLNRLNNYKAPLQDYIITITLNEEQWRRFRFKPKSLSQVLYGTTELGTQLLSLNGCVSAAEFDRDVIKVYDMGIKDILNEILNKEKVNIVNNEDEVTEDIKA